MPSVNEALALLSEGFSVLPVFNPTNGGSSCSCGNPTCGRNIGKHPYWRTAPNGVNAASADADEVRRLFEREGLNIGIACGERSAGLVVLDIDDEELAELLLEPNLGLMTTTRLSSTGRGLHIYVRTTGNLDPHNLIRDGGVKFGEKRGNGNYVVAPPSMHQNGKAYAWLNDVPILYVNDASAWLADILKKLGISLVERHYDFDVPEGVAVLPIDLPAYMQENKDIVRLAKGPTRHPGQARPDRSGNLCRLAHLISESAWQHKERLPFEAIAGIIKRVDAGTAYQKYTGRADGDTRYMEIALIATNDLETETRDTVAAHPYYWNGAASRLYIQRGQYDVQIANFLPLIEEDLQVDRGEDEDATHAYTVSFTRDERKVTVVVHEEDVEKHLRGIIFRNCPPDFIVEPDGWPRLWTAAQMLSESLKSIVVRRSYARTGWVEANDGIRFLLCGLPGSIGADGLRTDIKFEDEEVDSKLERYGVDVRPPITDEDRLAAERALGLIIGAAKPYVIVPVLAQIMAGPLFSMGLNAAPPLLHVSGTTGSHKTSLCSAVLNVFGRFDAPAETYESTANKLEKQLHSLADLTLLIDNYRPNGRGAASVPGLIQSYGDQMGRGRLTTKTYVPRGMWLSTGEALLGTIVSDRARVIAVTVAKGDIYGDAYGDGLRQLQDGAKAGMLGLIGGAYLAWLAAKGINGIKALVARCVRSALKYVSASGIGSIHARPVQSLANLIAAYAVMTEFVSERFPGASESFIATGKQGMAALLRVVEADAAEAQQLSAYNQIIEGLLAGIVSGSAKLAGRLRSTEDFGYPGGDRFWKIVGWIDAENIILNEATTFAWYREHARSQGISVPFTWEAFCDEAESHHGGQKHKLVRVAGAAKPIRATVVPREEILGKLNDTEIS